METQIQANNLNYILIKVLKGFKYLRDEQVKHIREGSWGIFFQKIYTLLILPFAAVAIVIIRISYPFITIRLGSIDGSRIGGAYAVLWYLSERLCGKYRGRFLDIFYFSPNAPISNQQWLKILKRHVFIFPFSKFANIVNKLNAFFPGFASHRIKYSHPPSGDTFKYVLAQDKPLFYFTPEEEILGQQMLRDLGVPKEVSFVCFHTRDNAFLKTRFPGKNWSYHDYRDTNIRNYLGAVENLVSKGYFAIRMGAVVNEKIICNNSAIIDYATNGKRTDFLDVYLGAKCRFFLGSDSGITIIPEAFKRPVVYTNWVSIQILPAHYYHRGLIIMKKWYSIHDRRFLTYGEILKFAKPHNIRLEEIGVKLIDNTPEEIMDVVAEMEQRLDRTWEAKKEDEALQQRFWVIYGADKLKGPEIRIGAEFLRQNQNLLS